MKKIMMALLALAFAAKVEAAASLLRWEFGILNSPVDNVVTAYLFALGNGPYDETSFGNGSFHSTALTLTPTDKSPITAEATVLGSTLEVRFDQDILDINQWWAVVLVNAETPNGFFIDVFEVTEMGNGAGIYRAILVVDDPEGYECNDYYPPDYSYVIIALTTINFSQYEAIPEPATGLLALGGVALLVAQRRKRK